MINREAFASKVGEIITDTVEDWHIKNDEKDENRVILNEKNTGIRKLGDFREDIFEVIKDLVNTNTEMWHEQDKIRSDNPKKLLGAIKNISPLNQYRNDLIEEIDEIILNELENSNE